MRPLPFSGLVIMQMDRLTTSILLHVDWFVGGRLLVVRLFLPALLPGPIRTGLPWCGNGLNAGAWWHGPWLVDLVGHGVLDLVLSLP